ncbi:hypothetical protein SCB49_08548 [unidentified eubacterium SCB49]|nr:hypothetical protein SCB49_08548 [unidentified eubacterium SCB49]
MSYGQTGGGQNSQGSNQNKDSKKQSGTDAQKKAPIDLYKIISADRDTIVLDTTLTLAKEYKFNYLREDTFELLPFANVGTPYNELAKSFDEVNLKPLFGARAQHRNYKEVEDILYYRVPTPLTEFYFKTAFQQGQQLDGLFAINTSEQFNFSLAYKGVRSLGSYQNRLTSTGNFRFTTSYFSKNKRYFLRAHLAAQDILNEQNGGITDEALPLYVNDDSNFTDRGRLEVNYEDAENFLKGIRYYIDQEYHVIKQQDSLSHSLLAIGNTLTYEEKQYRYQQDTAYEAYGEAYESTGLREIVRLQDLNAKMYARFSNNLIGDLSAFIDYTDFNYGYDAVLILDDGRIDNRIKGGVLAAGAGYQKTYKGFDLQGKGAINISGPYDGSYLTGQVSFEFLDDIKAVAGLKIHSVAPNFNTLLYQSDYVSYNWQNNFDNVNTQELSFGIESPTFGNINASYTGIDNYTYFGTTILEAATDETAEVISQPTPFQATERVDYLKIKLEKEFKYQNFRLANTILYQNVASGEAVFKVPTFITRNTLYYQDHWFKKALFLQTGVTFKYFPKYEMDAYSPVLGEFYVQDTEEIGGFPMIDVFFNAKVRQTRIFVKYEHVNALFKSTNDHFAAPGYPYRDAFIRFGLVWDFFL